MFTTLHNNKRLQLALGLLFGFCFGFLLQKGRVCDYEVIMGQLLLQDFTVLKVMLTAIVTGMVGVYAMRGKGWIKLHKQAGSLGTNIPGPLIFGIGFGLLGYCPGTGCHRVVPGVCARRALDGEAVYGTSGKGGEAVGRTPEVQAGKASLSIVECGKDAIARRTPL